MSDRESSELGGDILGLSSSSDASSLSPDVELEFDDGAASDRLEVSGSVRDAVGLIPDTISRLSSDVRHIAVQAPLKRIASKDYVVTSLFTGYGTDFCGVSWTLDSIQAVVSKQQGCKADSMGRYVSYSATDCGALQQRAIQAHSSVTRPLHMFSNVLGRLRRPDRRDLQRLSKKVQSRFFDILVYKLLTCGDKLSGH